MQSNARATDLLIGPSHSATQLFIVKYEGVFTRPSVNLFFSLSTIMSSFALLGVVGPLFVPKACALQSILVPSTIQAGTNVQIEVQPELSSATKWVDKEVPLYRLDLMTDEPYGPFNTMGKVTSRNAIIPPHSSFSQAI
jgi:hypothetical protein